MKILIIEDDIRTASFIKKGLQQEGFVVDHATDGRTGLSTAIAQQYDAAIVDIMLPKLDGLTLISTLRKNNITTPIIVLSAKASIDDRIKGLKSGGDDYLVKPFAFSELLERIHALIRRATRTTEPNALAVADLKIDIAKRKVFRGSKEIVLQPKEFVLLEYLVRNAGRIVSKTMIMEHVWDYNFDPQTNVVEARISHLRNKIDRDFDTKLIHTVRGVGYVIEDKQRNI